MRQPKLPGFASSGLTASTLTVLLPAPPDTDVDIVAESPKGMESPTMNPVFFVPATDVNAVANTDMSRHPPERVAETMSERVPIASMVWTKLPVRLACAIGSGVPTEMRLNAFGGRALVNTDELTVCATEEESATNELTSNGLVSTACCCNRAVTEARSSYEPKVICELALMLNPSTFVSYDK